MTKVPKIAALVSVGLHPLSRRPRRAPDDARAVELGLRLAAKHLWLLHAGDPDNGALRDYLGMGAEELVVLRQAPAADIVPALVSYLEQHRPDLILTGTQAEAGEDSGLVPYLVAEALGLPLVANAANINLKEQTARVLQALPRGQRRAVEVALPAIITIDTAAPAARQSAYGKSKRGRIVTVQLSSRDDPEAASWRSRPARQRPKRLKSPTGHSAAERLAALTDATGSVKGKVLTGLEPEAAAAEIHSDLQGIGVLRNADKKPSV